jgi:hypothetical protein
MKFEPITASEIVHSRKINPDAKEGILRELDYINRFATKSSNLWTVESAKIQKTDGFYKNVVLFLSPANEVLADEFTNCPWEGDNDCLPTCINKQGRNGMPVQQRAQRCRTVLLGVRWEYFKWKLIKELRLLAEQYDNMLLVRPDGTSDRDWRWLAALFPQLAFYGYSKGISKVRKHWMPNLRLVFSGSNKNEVVYKRTVEAVATGLSCAIALNTAGCKGEWELPDVEGLVDFDANDDRFNECVGTFGFLKRKGSTKEVRISEEVLTDSFFFNKDSFNNLIEDIDHAIR